MKGKGVGEYSERIWKSSKMRKAKKAKRLCFHGEGARVVSKQKAKSKG